MSQTRSSSVSSRFVWIARFVFAPSNGNDSVQLQDRKRELAKAALSGDKMRNMRLGADELAALFRPGGRDDEDSD